MKKITPDPGLKTLYSTSLLKGRLLTALGLFFFIVVSGTLGYHLLEGWSFFDGLYMTVITLATVGYGETHELSDGGRLFTIVLIFFSIGIVGFVASSMASFILEGELNRLIRGRNMDKRIAKLENHVILCGGGDTGQCIADEFIKTKTPFVIIDREMDPIRGMLQLGDIPYIQGNATEDEILILAGIQRARGLVTVLGEDKDNVFVVLSARALNPTLRIISRLTQPNNAEKLKKAGADDIVSPNAIGGMRIASLMLRPSVVNFLDAMLRYSDKTLRVEEYRVKESSPLFGKTISESQIARRTGLLVVAVIKPESGYIFNPSAETRLEKDDILIVMGPRDRLKLLG